MPAAEIFLTGLGACTAVGRTAPATAAAVRAGISGFAQHRFMLDTIGKPMRVAAAPWLDAGLPAGQRMERLLFAAIDEALADAAPGAARLGLALALPGPRPGLPALASADWSAAIAARHPNRFAGIAFFERGHASAILALEAAVAYLRRGDFDACLVAGVDTFMTPQTLEWLEACDQLHGAGPLNNAWGFVPGEGAAALMVASRADATARQPAGRVLAVASSVEAHRIKTRTVCVGRGLSDAMARVLSVRPPGQRVGEVYSDMNGETYRADEYGFAVARVSECFERASDMWTPADCTGDVGAASGALHLVLASIAARKRYAYGRLAMVHAGSESGERGVALVDFG